MKRFYFLIIAIAAVVFAVGAKVVRTTSTTDPVLTVTVDSIDFRTDLTRVYGKLVGRPHTSHRVDEATLLTGKTSFKADDIDGVDFKRYFQWEDEGEILIEIDFPKMKRFNAAQLILVTPRGESVTSVKTRK